MRKKKLAYRSRCGSPRAYRRSASGPAEYPSHVSQGTCPPHTSAKFNILNTQLLVFDTLFLVCDTQFMSFTHRHSHDFLNLTEPNAHRFHVRTLTPKRGNKIKRFRPGVCRGVRCFVFLSLGDGDGLLLQSILIHNSSFLIHNPRF